MINILYSTAFHRDISANVSSQPQAMFARQIMLTA